MKRRSDLLDWIALSRTAGMGTRTARELMMALGSPGAVLGADSGTLASLLGRARAQRLTRAPDRSEALQILRTARALGQRLWTPSSLRWPKERLASLADPPLALYVSGRLPRPGAPCAGIVGTRESSHYGLGLARALARDLVEAGVWVVSGMARGVDGAAHEGALSARPTRGASTVGVLGTGVDVAYPLAHLELRRQLQAQGGLISEHPPGTDPQRHHFPMRNRLIAALSDVVVVVEAPARSGALVTARHALEMGRDVLAVPGPAASGRHAGSHRLLREGAGLCENADDVLTALGLGRETPSQPTAAVEALPVAQAAILALLEGDESLPLDELCRRAGTPARELLLCLSQLELRGRARRCGGGWQALV